MDTVGAVVTKKILIEKFFAKGYEKSKILSEFLEKKVIILDDYACQK